MRRALGAACLAVAAALSIAACSGSSIPQEPLQPGTAPALTSHVVPSSPAAAARRAASETAHSTTRKPATTKAPARATVTGVIKGGQFCPASAHNAVGRDADGREYLCALASGVWQWRERPMVEHSTSATTKAPTSSPQVTKAPRTTATTRSSSPAATAG